MNETLALSAVALATLALALPAARRRLQLSAAKHPSLTGHARMAKRVAALLPGYAYDAERFFNSDGAPAEAVSRRRQALLRLSTLFATRHARSLALTHETAEGLSDLQFTGADRVPFQYSAYLRSQLSVPGFVQRVDDMVITDLDGNRLHDLTGSYGVIQCARWLACVGDRAYERTLQVNSAFNRARARLGLPYWSLSKSLKGKVKRAVSYIGDFEAAVAREARQRGLHGVVCGHIHHAEMREVEGVLYCNDGDWVESLTALVEHHDGRLEIADWSAHRSVALPSRRARSAAPAPSPAPVGGDTPVPAPLRSPA